MRRWVREALRQRREDVLSERVRQVMPLARLVYTVEAEVLQGRILAAWTQLHCDEETLAFVNHCESKSVAWEFVLGMVRGILRCCYSITDVNGMLKRGEMFVLSSQQCATLLDMPEFAQPQGRLLDVGAGDGNVTAKLAPFFETTITTEVSPSMATRLRKSGWVCYEIADLDDDTFTLSEPLFDVVSCLNVLDRCYSPVTLLRQIRSKLVRNGLLLLAVVLPFCPFVENGAKQDRPKEQLPNLTRCRSFEQALNVLITQVVEPVGYEIVRCARIPYLSAGDVSTAFYVLSDAVLVLKAI